MAKLNVSRGLLQLGDSLGQVAQSVAQRERDAMMAARDENLLRLQNMYREQADDRQFEQHKEVLGIEDTMRGAAETRRQGFETQQAGERRAHELALHDKDTSLRREMMGREEGLTRERWSREDVQALQQQYGSQIGEIDDRLSKINDEITKQRAAALKAGVEGDPKLEQVLQPWRQEIAQLQQQKRLLGQQRDMALAEVGAPGHRKLTPQEAEENRRVASSGQGRASHAPPKPRARAETAAQAGDVPPLPAKPPGMIEREQRRAQHRNVAGAAAPETMRPAERAQAAERELSSTVPKQGRDFSRTVEIEQERQRREILGLLGRLDLQVLLRSEKTSRKERAIIREILAQRSREETKRRRAAYIASRSARSAK